MLLQIADDFIEQVSVTALSFIWSWLTIFRELAPKYLLATP